MHAGPIQHRPLMQPSRCGYHARDCWQRLDSRSCGRTKAAAAAAAAAAATAAATTKGASTSESRNGGGKGSKAC